MIYKTFLSFLFLFTGCTSAIDQEINQLSKTEPAAKITSIELFNEFRTDRKEAKMKFKEKIIEITGTIDRIGTNTKGELYVSLKGMDSVGSVQAYFLGKVNEEAKKLKMNQQITVRGRCTGFLINVILDRCILISK